MMPNMDGFTVAKTFREKQNFTPILMLTALGKPENVLTDLKRARTIICRNLLNLTFFRPSERTFAPPRMVSKRSENLKNSEIFGQ